MAEKLIKSSDRVKDIGEVFTPRRIVNMMLDQPEIQEKINDLSATFFEPSAGEGAFLTEILSRKMKIAEGQSNSLNEYENNILLALSTLYGIELMEDNVEMLVMNMASTFDRHYLEVVNKVYGQEPNPKVIRSARVIIQANMAQGDTLKRVTSDGDPIIFSEWKPLKNGKVQRTEFTFDSIVEGGDSNKSVTGYTEEIDLFEDYDENQDFTDEADSKSYLPVKWTDVYKRLIG